MPTCDHGYFTDEDCPTCPPKPLSRDLIEQARLRAIESAARDVYKTALATNGKVTMGQWAKLGDELDGRPSAESAPPTGRP